MNQQEIDEINLALELLGKHPLSGNQIDLEKYIEFGKKYDKVKKELVKEMCSD